MNPELITISSELLFEYLEQKESPVMEFDIIRQFIPRDSVEHDSTLFVKHFSIYNALYNLKFSAGRRGYYLHLDCMRIRMVKIPEQGCCGHYDPETGKFCMKETESENDFCVLHWPEYSNYRNSVTVDYLYDFYTDPENISFGESVILEKLMNGIRVYCLKKSDIDNALKFFGIHKPGRKAINGRYRELAGIYHPDRNNGSDEMMKQLNSAYAILKEVYVV